MQSRAPECSIRMTNVLGINSVNSNAGCARAQQRCTVPPARPGRRCWWIVDTVDMVAGLIAGLKRRAGPKGGRFLAYLALAGSSCLPARLA